MEQFSVQLSTSLEKFAMRWDFGILPSREHYTSLVDLLGRAGQLELALKIITVVPVNVQARFRLLFLALATLSWGSLQLESC